MSRPNDDRGSYEHLEQSLVGPEPDTVLPTTTATPMIEVVAPANLPENYTFEAEVNGKTFTVMAPKGGVEEGQKFTVPLPGGSEAVSNELMLPKASVPVGHWKDGLWDCCAHGCIHAALWNSFLCLPIAAGQVITRLRLNWLGKPADNVAQSAGAFHIIFGIVVTWITIHWGFNLLIVFNLPPEDSHQSIPGFVIFLAVIRDLCFYSYLVFTIYLLRNVRSHVRTKYGIPEDESCRTGCEDTCCAIVCPCLTAAQLLRHTADYNTYGSVCCSSTGLPANVPAIV